MVRKNAQEVENKNPFFTLEDFKSIEMIIDGLNSTSQVKIPGGVDAIQLVQILPDGVWIEVPPKSCAMGHTLSLHIIARWLAPQPAEKEYVETQLHILGVIEQIEESKRGRPQVRLKFRQFAQEHWDSLLDYFTQKQLSLNELIKVTRK